MKPPTKVLALTVALIVGLPLAAWCGVLGYWHVRITGAIRSIDARHVPPTGLDGLDRPELSTLTDAGCRSIPYLLRVLESSREDNTLANATHVISQHLAKPPNGIPEEESLAILGLFQDCSFRSHDPPDLRRRDFLRIAQLWEQHRPRHNPWWRVWTVRCAS